MHVPGRRDTKNEDLTPIKAVGGLAPKVPTCRLWPALLV